MPKNILLERRSDHEAIVQMGTDLITILFAAGNVWFMHVCGANPNLTETKGVNITVRYTGDDLVYACQYCGLNGNMKWDPNGSDKVNLDLVLLQLITTESTVN